MAFSKFLLTFVLSFSVLAGDAQTRSATYYFEKGEESLKNKSYKTALAHFNECLRLSPFYYDAYYSRGLVREQMGDHQGALTDFNIYLESDPEDKEVLFTRAVSRYNFGQWAMAKEDFLKLLSLPEGGETNTVYFQTGQAGDGTTRAFTAQRHLKSTLYNYLGLIETKLKVPTKALLYYDSAITLEPTNSDYFLNRGLAYQVMLDTVRAVRDYQQALSLNPENSLAKHNLALFVRGSDNLKSEVLLSEAIEANPKLPYSYAERGLLRMKTKNLRGALDDYNQAVRLNPNEVDYWLNRGLIKEQLNDIPGALADYQQVIALKPDYEKGWLNHGNACVKLNRFADAIEDYTVAITYYPEYGLAYYNRCVAYHRLGKKAEACEDLKHAQKLGISVDSKMKTQICETK